MSQKLDQELAEGKIRGPLHGVPITIKEQLPIKGFHQTQGVKSLKDHIAKEDCIIWTRFSGKN